METLKADKKSIVFGAPACPTRNRREKRQIETMVMAQMRSRGKKPPKGLQTPQTVTVTSTLTAQWPIAADSHEKLLLTAQDIQDEDQGRRSGRQQRGGKTLARGRRIRGRSRARRPINPATRGPADRQPQFVFVAVLPKAGPPEGHDRGVAKAKEQAAELAKAAGVELGPLVGLAGGCTGQVNMGEENQYGGMYPGRRMFLQQAAEDVAGKPDESVGTDPSATVHLRRHGAVSTRQVSGRKDEG